MTNSKMQIGGFTLDWISTRLGDLLRSSIKLFRMPTLFTLPLQRPYVCPVDGCKGSYRRKDHLNRHLITHEGKIFQCPIENCSKSFNIKANMQRHVVDMHDETSPRAQNEQYICQEHGCGKVFKFASKLKKHEESHAKLGSIEVMCTEPGCRKFFSNTTCLKAHKESSHRYIFCEICRTKQLKKNFKRHMRVHNSKQPPQKFTCTEADCGHTFSSKSNLTKHIKSSHLKQKVFGCKFDSCRMKFSYKHVRDKHEKTHFATHGDFVEADQRFMSKPRGGRTKTPVTVDDLLRKRVVPNMRSWVLENGTDYLRFFLSEENE